MLVISCLTPGGGASGAQSTGGGVDPRAGQDTLENRKFPFTWWELNHYSTVTQPTDQSVHQMTYPNFMILIYTTM